MESPSTFPFARLLEHFPGVQPPPWVVHEVQQRVLLLVNHVLQQEPEAMQRLARFRGRVILAQHRQIRLPAVVTPAGLFDLADGLAQPDLTVTLAIETPVDFLRQAAQGERPAVRIEGDVELAAEVGWIADHVRWDYEEDLARVLGDSAAHSLATMGRQIAQALGGIVRPNVKSPG